MSAVDCRSGKCSCAAKSEKLGEAERVLQVEQSGWLNGGYDWDGEVRETHVTAVRARHVANRIQPIAEADGWLIYQSHPHVPELNDTDEIPVARIRWEPAEAVNRG